MLQGYATQGYVGFPLEKCILVWCGPSSQDDEPQDYETFLGSKTHVD